MLIIGVLLVMWAVLLIPLAVRKFRDATSDRSISSFHRSLGTLKRGPQEIAPAHRLDSEDDLFGDHPPVVPVAPRSPIQPRPQLVLLRSDDQGGSVMQQRYDYEEQYDDGYVDDYRYENEAPEFEAHYPADPYVRRQAALRRRNILFGLLGTFAVSGIFGFLAPIFWNLTILAIVLTVLYVGLMAWAATRGSITISKPRMLARDEQIGDRHVARAVVDGYAARTEEWADEDAEDWEYDEGAPAATYADRFEDDWWEEPRRVAAR